MFGSIGQPVSGAKNKQTSLIFLRSLRDDAAKLDATRCRRKRTRERVFRVVKGWFATK